MIYFQVVTEYERAVIFRLGRLRKGGSKGPGIFTVIPCIDSYRCVDLRTVSFDVPPQEVSICHLGCNATIFRSSLNGNICKLSFISKMKLCQEQKMFVLLENISVTY